MAQNCSHNATVQSMTRRVIGTDGDGRSFEPFENFVQRQFKQVSHKRKRRTRKHIPGCIDGQAVPSRIARFQFSSTQPAHTVFDKLSKVAGRNQLIIEEPTKDGDSTRSLIHEELVRSAIRPNIPMVDAHNRQEPLLTCESDNRLDLGSIGFAHDADQKLRMGEPLSNPRPSSTCSN